MTKNYILKECCQIIDNHCEEDCECWGVGYYLSYYGGRIIFERVTSHRTYEDYSDGGIGTKSSIHQLCNWVATLEDYCNLAIKVHQQDEELKHECGYSIRDITFKYV